jgi:hypothetical protein
MAFCYDMVITWIKKEDIAGISLVVGLGSSSQVYVIRSLVLCYQVIGEFSSQ